METCALLLTAGATMVADHSKRTPLHACCTRGSYDVVLMLLEHGADPHHGCSLMKSMVQNLLLRLRSWLLFSVAQILRGKSPGLFLIRKTMKAIFSPDASLFLKLLVFPQLSACLAIAQSDAQ